MRTLRPGEGKSLVQGDILLNPEPLIANPVNFPLYQVMSSEPSYRAWTTGAGIEVVVMAKALIA